MKNKQAVKSPRDGAHKLRDAFRIIGISEVTGHALIKAGKIRTIRMGPRLPLITDREIDRLLEHGVDGTEATTPVASNP
jgi:hypothetical protein